MTLTCAICMWLEPDKKKWNKADTVCNGTAVCDGHLTVTLQDTSLQHANNLRHKGIDIYIPD